MRRGTGRVYDATVPMRRIDMTLNEDLVRVARDHTDNLSDYAGESWASAIEVERLSKLADPEHWDRVCASWTKFHEKHGCVADDHISDYLPEDRVS